MEIAGLPLHALVVHAAVVLTPAAALLAAVFALRERWRWATRWPTLVGTVAALGCLLVAKVSGAALLRSREYLLQSSVLAARIHTHKTRADQLVVVMVVFTVLVLVAGWSLGGPSPLAGGRGARDHRLPGLRVLLPLLVVVGAAAVLVWVVLTGDAGARAVWG